ncbi:MAG: ATP-binding cassette domain-containing protein, partial [candidate division KSB1 bacterium]|nr:ATP-binding cassette domain-containing protein [candidate division KSB1 bacterium]
GFRQLLNRVSNCTAITIGLVGLALIWIKNPRYGVGLDEAATIAFPLGYRVPLLPWLACLIGACVFAIVCSLWRMAELWPRAKGSIGGLVTHVGVVLTMSGLIVSRGFERDEITRVEPGRSGAALDRIIALKRVDGDLFDRNTIRDNIAFGREDASDEEIIAAAKAAQAHDFIMQLPDGYDTMIWDGGDNLSGGQRQRLSIARAMLRNSPILILDEPSAGLDAKAEALVTQAIEELTRNKTTFIIAHRFSTIRNADKIIVLEQGRLAQVGTHEQLMDTSPQYRELYELQVLGHRPKAGRHLMAEENPPVAADPAMAN